MTVVGYAFDEGWASLRRSGRSAFVSIGTIAIAFATLGGFLLISVNVQDVLDRWLDAAEMSVYLHDAVSDAERAALEEHLRAQAVVAGVEYVSRERALDRFRVDFPELRDVAEGVGENPFPPSLEVRLRPDAVDAAAALSRDLAGRPGVADVRYDQRWLSRLVGIVTAARVVGALATAILMLGAAFTVAAVVRLSLHARRDELEIMQLAGAPFSYIRGPFIVEGMLLGGIGAAVALASIAALYSTVLGSLGSNVAGVTDLTEIRFLGVAELLLMLAGGVLVGGLAGIIASRAIR